MRHSYQNKKAEPRWLCLYCLISVYDLIVNLNLAIVELAEDARHETCSRSLLLQMSHNETDLVNSASPKGFKW
jgi:hypothetical protein